MLRCVYEGGTCGGLSGKVVWRNLGHFGLGGLNLSLGCQE